MLSRRRDSPNACRPIAHRMNTNPIMKATSVFKRNLESDGGPTSRPGVSPGQRRPTAREGVVGFANVGLQTRWGGRDACPALAAPPPGALRLKCLAVAAACSLPLLL